MQATLVPGQNDNMGQPVGVIDIGSNSVRLVVYDALTRAPTPIFNEKAMCGLGRNVAITGRLPEDGVAQALSAMRRFRALADLMGVTRLYTVATAAARPTSRSLRQLPTADRSPTRRAARRATARTSKVASRRRGSAWRARRWSSPMVRR